MTRLIQSFIAASLLGLAACGGGGGGSSSSEGAEDDSLFSAGDTGLPAVEEETVDSDDEVITGISSKGLIAQGRVRAYLFDENGEPDTSAIVQGTTNSNGQYSLVIPNAHLDKPLLIEVTDNNGSAIMKCDIANGCDNDGDGEADAEFGANLNLSAGDLTLRAMTSTRQDADGAPVNITVLTTVAAALAQEAIATGSSSKSAIQDAIATSNTQVADRFNLSQDVTTIPIVDLTDANAVATTVGELAGNEAIRYAAINAAIISAVQADSTRVRSINQTIAFFADDYVTSGLTNNSITGDVTDLGEILADALRVIDTVVAEVTNNLGSDDLSLTELANISDAIETDQNAADSETASDSGYQGTANSLGSL